MLEKTSHTHILWLPILRSSFPLLSLFKLLWCLFRRSIRQLILSHDRLLACFLFRCIHIGTFFPNQIYTRVIVIDGANKFYCVGRQLKFLVCIYRMETDMMSRSFLQYTQIHTHIHPKLHFLPLSESCVVCEGNAELLADL